MKSKRFRIEWLPFAALRLDPTYQRVEIPARVTKLTREWALEKVGALTVSVHDGKAFVVDGQHRWRTAMGLGLGDTKVLCHVYSDLTPEQEAALFLSLNDARPVTPLDKFRAALVAKDPVAIGVRDILAERGLKIDYGTTNGSVRCVDKALKLYERDPGLLRATVVTLTEAWGTRQGALEQVVFVAMGTILGKFNGQLDRPRLVKKLAKYRGGPSALVGDARGLADVRPISVTRAAAEIIRDTYNRGGRSDNDLPPL